jgi:hypothetical protein
MNPNNLFAEVKCTSVQKQTTLGIIIPKKDRQCFVLLNFGSGHSNVIGSSRVSDISTKALYQQWNKPYSFNKLVKLLGGEMVDKSEESDYDFSISNLDKDSFTKLFN